jgi:hypothetical protein
MVIAALVSALFFVMVPRASADDDHAKCQHRIEKSEVRLQNAIRDHGAHSQEARERRHELDEEREHCWTAYHGWWSGADHHWHTERDWDRDEHDRDDHDRDDHRH